MKKNHVKIILLAALSVAVMAVCITFFVLMLRAKKATGENSKEAEQLLKSNLYTVDCIDGLAFGILPDDFTNVKYTFNPPLFDVLEITRKEEWSYDDAVSVPEVFVEQGLPLLVMSDNKFLLYNPEGNVYLAGRTALGGISLFYAVDDRKFAEVIPSYGISDVTDIVITENSYIYKNTDDYILSAFNGEFKFHGRDYAGFFVFVENEAGQFYYIGGGDFDETEKESLSNSFIFKNDATDTTIEAYGVNTISVNFGADVLSFNTSEIFAFNPDNKNTFVTTCRGFLELNAYNQYLDLYSVMSVVYMDYEGVAAKEFMCCFDNTVFFPDSVLSSEKVSDAEGREWEILVFDTDYTSSGYDRCVAAVCESGNLYYMLKTDYSSDNRFSDTIYSKFKSSVSSARITQGEGIPYTESTEHFKYFYNFLVLGIDIYAEPEQPAIPDGEDLIWVDDSAYDTETGGVITLRMYNPNGEDKNGFWFSVCEETTGEGSDGVPRGVGSFLSDYYGRGHAAYNGYNPAEQLEADADLLTDVHFSVNHLPVEGVLDITASEDGEVSTGIYSVAATGYPEGFSGTQAYVIKINGKFAVLDENGVFVEGTGEDLAFPVTVQAGEKIYLKLSSPVVAEIIIF